MMSGDLGAGCPSYPPHVSHRPLFQLALGLLQVLNKEGRGSHLLCGFGKGIPGSEFHGLLLPAGCPLVSFLHTLGLACETGGCGVR